MRYSRVPSLSTNSVYFKYVHTSFFSLTIYILPLLWTTHTLSNSKQDFLFVFIIEFDVGPMNMSTNETWMLCKWVVKCESIYALINNDILHINIKKNMANNKLEWLVIFDVTRFQNLSDRITKNKIHRKPSVRFTCWYSFFSIQFSAQF